MQEILGISQVLNIARSLGAILFISRAWTETTLAAVWMLVNNADPTALRGIYKAYFEKIVWL